MRILLLALWLQMSASTTGILHKGSMTVDHGKLLSTQIACIKTYADGFIEYNPCEISTPPTDNFVKPAVQYNPPGISMLPVAWPQPVDVPAVQEFGGHMPNVDDRRKCVADSEPAESGVACLSDQVWTCKDKSRVLLMSENGEKHCIKF